MSKQLLPGASFPSQEAAPAAIQDFKRKLLEGLLLAGSLVAALFVLADLLGWTHLGSPQVELTAIFCGVALVLAWTLSQRQHSYTPIALISICSGFLLFASAWLFVPADELRSVWFFLGISTAYILLGSLAGWLYTLLSIGFILLTQSRLAIPHSGQAITTLTLALVWCSALFHLYTRHALTLYARLQASDARYRLLVETANEGIGVAQAGLLRFVNPQLARELGYAPEELVGRPFLDFIHPDDQAMVLDKYQRRLRGETVEGRYELRVLNRQGNILWYETSGTRIEWDGQPATLNFLTEITERKHIQAEIQNMAYHDALTGLPNRRLLEQRMDEALAATRQARNHGALLLLDLDNFKPLNDEYGHGAGDLLLQEVAQRLRTSLRSSDTVARLGGDEFVILLSHLDQDPGRAREQARSLAEKLRQELERPYPLQMPDSQERITYPCTASIGIALFDGEAHPTQIIKQADLAMYQVKEQGRNGIGMPLAPSLAS